MIFKSLIIKAIDRFLDYLSIPELKMRLITLLLFSSFSASSWANVSPLAKQCRINTPYIAPSELPQLQLSGDKVSVNADKANIQYPDILNYLGNVTFTQNQKFIRADQARYDQTANIFSATGNLHFQDDQLTLTSESLTTSLNGKNTELAKTKYWFNNSMIHGSSGSFRVEDGRFLILDDALFTTCPDDTPDWALRAKEIKIDSSEAWATIRRATLEVFEVPVFYFPYLTLPISDKRSSGFLYPSIGSNSRNGLEISTPYYWNIAPNYDMTITPRLMSERGVQLINEFRYLSNGQTGLLNLEYLHHDRSADDKRYLTHWQHNGSIAKNWRIASTFTHVSDDNYFNDIGSQYGSKTDNQLTKNIELAYYSDDWWLNMRAQDIQVLGAQTKPYQLMPQLAFHSYNNALGSKFKFDIFSELSHFRQRDNNQSKASRLHIEPTLRLPINLSAINFITEAKLMQTWYKQDDGIESQSISRTLPQFRFYGDVNFERQLKLVPNHTQTLTPKIQYLYVPFESQKEIGLYDTALLRDDYAGLFRTRRFSGLDRIIDTEQLTFGVTTELKDENNQPYFKGSIGQTFYLRQSEMAIEEGNAATNLPDRSALAGEFSYTLNKQWQISHAMQLNDKQDTITQSKTSVDYHVSASKLVQLSHRFVKQINDSKISQLGLQTVWPINNEWTFVGNYYRDINLNRTIEAFAGLQYESCCWSIRVQAYRQLQAQFSDNTNSFTIANEEFDNGIAFNFEIKGLGSPSSKDASDMFSNGLFTYRKPYYLKQ